MVKKIAFNIQHYTAHMSVIIAWDWITLQSWGEILLSANVGMHGAGMLMLEGRERYDDVSALAGYIVNQLCIVIACALITTNNGNTIATFHHMALLGKRRIILSCI
jgi:hypothetical protein